MIASTMMALLFCRALSTNGPLEDQPPRVSCLIQDQVAGSPTGIVTALKAAGFDGVVPVSPSRTALARAARDQGSMVVIRTAGSARSQQFLVWDERRVRGPAEHALPIDDRSGESILAVMSGRLLGKKILAAHTIRDLTRHVHDGGRQWKAPQGLWSILVFRTVTGQVPAQQANGTLTLCPIATTPPERLAWSPEIPRRYAERYGERLAAVDFAALTHDIGDRTEIIRIRLKTLTEEARQSAPTLYGYLDAKDPLLPFVVPNPRVVRLSDWSGPATARYYGWNVRAAAGLLAARGQQVACLLPQEGTWAVPPAMIKFHMDLTFLWGAQAIILAPLAPDAIRFAENGTAPELPVWWRHLGDINRSYRSLVSHVSVESSSAKTPRGADIPAESAAPGSRSQGAVWKPEARIAVATVKDDLRCMESLGQGPAVASRLAAECRDLIVTEIGTLAEHGQIRHGKLAYGPYRLRSVVVATSNVLAARHAEILSAWAEQGIAVVFAGSLPTISSAGGRSCPKLRAAMTSLKKRPGFLHAVIPEKAIEHLRTVVPPVIRVAAGRRGTIWVRTFSCEGRPIFFLLNSGPDRWHGEVAIPGQTMAAYREGQTGENASSGPLLVPPQRRQGDDLIVELDLLPYQSVLLEASPAGPAFVQQGSQALDGPWTVVPLEAEGSAGSTPGSLEVQTMAIFRTRAEAERYDVAGEWRSMLRFDLLAGLSIDVPRWHGVWITSPEGEVRGEEFARSGIRFHRTFHLDEPAVKGRLVAMADSGCEIEVNDGSVCVVPARTLVEADVAPFLAPGKNTVKTEVRNPGRLLLELHVRSIDGTAFTIATDRRWRTSVRRTYWKPAFPLSRPSPTVPGPLDAAPDTLWGVLQLPVGAAAVRLPDGWRNHGYRGADGAAVEPVFPLSRPIFLLVSVPRGPAACPVVQFTPTATALRPLAELGLDDFAGRVRYQTRFTLTPELADSDAPLVLDLGDVGFFAEVWIDRLPEAGSATCPAAFAPPYRVPIGSLAAGEHTLCVDITTLSAARRRFLWPASTVPPGNRRFLIEKNAHALSCGLKGPVRLHILKKVRDRDA